jgi:2-polyprenyl-6-methoxyphenol hydroxylase-like FAD-dependent oxidoreductase
VVLERHRELHRVPKGQNLTQRSGEHFQIWGVSDAIRAASPIPPDYGNSGVTAYGSLLGGRHYDWYKRGSVGAYYNAVNERLPQYETERVLRARAAELPLIDVRYGIRAEAVKQQADGVMVIGRAAGNDQNIEFTGQYVVGCDGSRSTVRQQSAITQTVDPRGIMMVLLVFNSEELDQRLSVFPGKTIYNVLDPALNGYWQFLGRVDLESNWFFHAPVPADTTRENFDFSALLHQAIGAEFKIKFDHIGFWDLRFEQADSYRDGRILIAGDAAHSHPPYGGFGINTGFEDSRNLGWKLEAVLRWGADERLLNSYGEERHPVFADTRDSFIAKMIDDDAEFLQSFSPALDRAAFDEAWTARAQTGNSAVGQFLPNYGGSSLVWGETGSRSGAEGVHRHVARAGYHLSPQSLSDGQNIYDRMGPHFNLILIGQTEAFIETVNAELGGTELPVEVITSAATAGTENWQARIILVRPDHFIAFASTQLPHAIVEIVARSWNKSD